MSFARPQFFLHRLMTVSWAFSSSISQYNILINRLDRTWNIFILLFLWRASINSKERLFLSSALLPSACIQVYSLSYTFLLLSLSWVEATFSGVSVDKIFFPYILKINFSHSWASNLEICVFKLGWTKLKVKMQTLKGKKRGTIGEFTSRSEFFSITIIFTRCFSLQNSFETKF